MLFSRRETRNDASQRESATVILRATRSAAGKNNRSRVFALMVVCFALSLGSIFATVPEAAPTLNELLVQGRKLLEAGKVG